MYKRQLTLWEIYERATPFASMPEAAVVNQVLSGRRPKLAKTPESTRPLVEACWSEDPKERPGADRVALMLTNLWTNHPDHEPTKSGDETEISEGPPSAGEKKKKSDEKAAAKKKAEAKKKEEEAAAKEARDAEAAVSDLLSRLRRWRDGDAATRRRAGLRRLTTRRSAPSPPRGLGRSRSSGRSAAWARRRRSSTARTCSRSCAGRARARRRRSTCASSEREGGGADEEARGSRA